MRILMVGALSWNPERVRSLHEADHELWGVWARSRAWDQGPYPMLDGCLRTVAIEDAALIIAEERIDVVCALFQVYDPAYWGAPAPGIEHDVWTLLRVLLAERARGTFDVPIVFHWGFDVHTLDPDVVRALDGQVFCNRELYKYWTTPVADGGAGLDLFDDCPVVDFFDGDRAKREFMNDDVAPLLSAHTGEVHTACIGRPFNIDYLASARAGIHLHIYGNGVDQTTDLIARDLIRQGVNRPSRLLEDHIHVHASRQPTGRSWTEVREWKSQWVREFSRYDAGWSYIGSPYAWPPLEDAAAIPNRLSTYVLVGLPVITDPRPGFYRYEELARLGIAIVLEDSDYARLRASLEAEAVSGERRRNALAARAGYSFDASIEPLIAFFDRARGEYFGRPPAHRRRPVPEGAAAGIRPPASDLAPRVGLARRARTVVGRTRASVRSRRIVRRLRR